MPNDCPNHETSADYRMAVFVKENLYPRVVSIHNNDDSLWVKIKIVVRGKKENNYIGTVMRLWMTFIFSWKSGWGVIIQGDFNARTNVDDNLLKPDKFDKLINIDNGNNKIPPRNSKDELPSHHRRKELLELCEILNLFFIYLWIFSAGKIGHRLDRKIKP